ncbi:Os06g0602950 [Oryza sativa Japonica Group]|uniref:Os06g0602950 protein n=1 Tax=Oryza sativa subsp. japonica TaxID=39947 RepID=A0A0P0WYE6_ORYSJ|nr:Os06g0602950 [Oryza sativa Japonica Group]
MSIPSGKYLSRTLPGRISESLLLCAMSLRVLAYLGVGAGAADDVAAGELGELADEAADGARRRRHEHLLPRLRPAHLVQPRVRRHPARPCHMLDPSITARRHRNTQTN